jgi:hypothetical protein
VTNQFARMRENYFHRVAKIAVHAAEAQTAASASILGRSFKPIVDIYE